MPATLEVETMRPADPEPSRSDASAAPLARAPTITWFEIPALDYEATVAFYDALLGAKLQRVEDPEMGAYAKFDGADDGTQGCVAPARGFKPSADGTVVYLWCGVDLDPVLARAAELGARIAAPKCILPHGIGAVAQIVDPEGNRVGLHARR
jgi:predicted enzyme related to lactoylglutathione lyase